MPVTWSAPSHHLNQCWNIVNLALANQYISTKMHLKMLSAKWDLFHPKLNSPILFHPAFTTSILGVSCHFYDGPGGSFHTNFTWNARVTISQKLRMNYIRNSDALHMNFLRSSYKFLMNYTWNHISIFHVNFVCISYVRLVKITRSNAK